MATVTPGIVWVSGETVTPAKLNSAAAPTVVVADGEVTDAKLAATLDLSSKTVTLPDDSVTNAKLSLAANDGEIKKAINADNSAPIYACRAWVNFDGTAGSTVDGEFRCTIRASGNVSKVVRNSTGNYTISFTTAMPDANYATVASINKGDANADAFASSITGTSAAFQTASAASIVTAQGGIYPANVPQVSVAIFR
jgi:hypothetical protein